MDEISPLDAMIANQAEHEAQHAPRTSTATYEPLNEEPVPALDESNERDQLRTLLDQLRVLTKISDSITESRKVSRSQVQELVGTCNVALDSRTPVMSYTAQPSEQNYDFACEGVVSRAGEIARSIVQHAAELIRKIIRWLVEQFERLTGRNSAVRQRTAYTTEVQEASTEAKQAGIDEASASPASRETLSKAVEAYTKGYSELTHTLLSDGPLLGLVRSLGLALPKYVEQADQKLLYTEQTFDTQQDEKLFVQSLVQIATFLPIDELTHLAAKFPVLVNQPHLAEYLSGLKSLVEDMRHSYHQKPMDWQVAVRTVVDPSAHFDDPMVPMPDRILTRFRAMEKRIEKLVAKRDSLATNPHLAGYVDQAMVALVGDVHGLMFYVEAVNLVLNSQATLVNQLYQCSVAQFNVYRSAAEETQKPEWVEAINAIQKKLKQNLGRGPSAAGKAAR